MNFSLEIGPKTDIDTIRADKLGGELKKLFIQDSTGRKYYRIVIEYEEEKE